MILYLKKINCSLFLLLGFSVCLSHASSHRPQAFLDSIAGTKSEGKKIVQHFCSNCHADKPLIPLGAPRPSNLNDWKPRLKQGMALLFKRSSEGFGAMPARGGCFECSDEQLLLAIKALLPPLQESHPNDK